MQMGDTEIFSSKFELTIIRNPIKEKNTQQQQTNKSPYSTYVTGDGKMLHS